MYFIIIENEKNYWSLLEFYLWKYERKHENYNGTIIIATFWSIFV